MSRHAEPGRRLVLIVEDDEERRTCLLDRLSAMGYRAVGASCGKEGLAMLDHGETPDVIVLCVGSSRTGAIDFLACLRCGPGLRDVPVFLVAPGRTRIKPPAILAELVPRPSASEQIVLAFRQALS